MTCVSEEVYTAKLKVYLLMEMSIGGAKCIRLIFYFCYSDENLCSRSADNYVVVDFVMVIREHQSSMWGLYCSDFVNKVNV